MHALSPRYYPIAYLVLATLVACGNGSGGSKPPSAQTDTAAPLGETISQWGYIPLADGTRLRYHLERHKSHTVGPVLLQYDGYSAGQGPTLGTVSQLRERLMPKGYVFLGVSIRGTGCSSGSFDLFSPQWAEDGAEIVEWAARQSWSNGKVGMTGYSYPGIMQLFTAAQQPPSLAAIAPNAVIWDLYRDVAFPGGIFNLAFAALFTAQQQEPGLAEAPGSVIAGDSECLFNQLIGRATAEQITLQGLNNPFWDSPLDYPARSPGTLGRQIDVPVLSINAWQDQQTGPRIGGVLSDDGLPESLNPDTSWFFWSNGYHSTLNSNTAYLDALEQFYDYYLLGIDNDWEATPRLQIQHELVGEAAVPSWTDRYHALPHTSPQTLYLHTNGRMDTQPPSTDEGSVSWLYPGPSPQTLDSVFGIDLLWQLGSPLGDDSAAVFTTPALGSDTELLGSASVDLWLQSSAPSTDLQATLTEVRPDGQEVYVQRGWLRASHRQLDRARSRPTRPYQLHTQASQQALNPELGNLVNIEIFPFNHVFRKGSAIRLIIDAPLGFTGDWALLIDSTVARNQINISQQQPSKLVVGHLGSRTRVPSAYPRCGELIGQPCRPSIRDVPPGELSLSAPSSFTARPLRGIGQVK